MANGHGGKRKGSGRKPLRIKFRDWCRSVIEDPEVQAAMWKRAKEDPLFALKLAEHGYGRPPQGLDLTVSGDKDHPIYQVIMPGAGVVPAAVTGVSATCPDLDGEG